MTRLEGASYIGVGTSRLRSAGGGLAHDEAVAFLRSALDLGITFFDTANIYGQGDAERALGSAFRRRRDDVVLATKVGYAMPRGAAWVRGIKPMARRAAAHPAVRRAVQRVRGSAGGRVEVSPDEMTRAVEASLGRLETDYVDVLYLHNPGMPDRSVGAEVLDLALSRGLCRRAGVSVLNTREASEWFATGLVDVAQVGMGLGSLGAPELLTPSSGSIVGREVYSQGRHFDRGWRVGTLANTGFVESELLHPDRPETYLRWLSATGRADHVLLGTTNIKHLERSIGLST